MGTTKKVVAFVLTQEVANIEVNFMRSGLFVLFPFQLLVKTQSESGFQQEVAVCQL